MSVSSAGSNNKADKDTHWYFTADQLQNSPSRRFGIDSDTELSYRQMTAYLIQEMGQRLQVSQLCINTAIVYMHRFYAFHSFTQFHRNGIAAASLFLAAKVEEQPRKLEHVIKAANKCLNQPTSSTADAYYMEQAQDLVFNENVLLQTLGFDVAIDHPHTHVVHTCQLVKAGKDLAQTSYFLASNSLHLTSMCLQYKPTVVACFCIYLACKWSRWEIPQSTEGKHWFHYVDKSVTMDLLKQLTEEFIAIYEKSPARLKSKLNSIKALAQGAGNRIGGASKKSGQDDWKMGDIMKLYHDSTTQQQQQRDHNDRDSQESSMSRTGHMDSTISIPTLSSNSLLLPPPTQPIARKSDTHSSQRGSSGASGSASLLQQYHPQKQKSAFSMPTGDSRKNPPIVRSRELLPPPPPLPLPQPQQGPSSISSAPPAPVPHSMGQQQNPMYMSQSSQQRSQQSAHALTSLASRSHVANILPSSSSSSVSSSHRPVASTTTVSSSRDRGQLQQQHKAQKHEAPAATQLPQSSSSFGKDPNKNMASTNKIFPPPFVSMNKSQQQHKMAPSMRAMKNPYEMHAPPQQQQQQRNQGTISGGFQQPQGHRQGNNHKPLTLQQQQSSMSSLLQPPTSNNKPQIHQIPMDTMPDGQPQQENMTASFQAPSSYLASAMMPPPPAPSAIGSADDHHHNHHQSSKAQYSKMPPPPASVTASLMHNKAADNEWNASSHYHHTSISAQTLEPGNYRQFKESQGRNIIMSGMGDRNNSGGPYPHATAINTKSSLSNNLGGGHKSQPMDGSGIMAASSGGSHKRAAVGNLQYSNNSSHEDDLPRDVKVRKLDLEAGKAAAPPISDLAKGQVMNGIETNPDLVSSLLKESLCTTAANSNLMVSTVNAISPVSQVLPEVLLNPLNTGNTPMITPTSTSLVARHAGDSTSKELAKDIAAESSSSSKSEKKKKKEKHKHKEKDKDKSKDRDEKKEHKKHKKDKDKHKERERDDNGGGGGGAVGSHEHVKITIPKDKIKERPSKHQEPVELKIKIPKNRIIDLNPSTGKFSGSSSSSTGADQSGGMPPPPSMALVQPTTTGLKIKISKDKIENYCASTPSSLAPSSTASASHGSSHNQISHSSGANYYSSYTVPSGGGGHSTLSSSSAHGHSGHSSSSKKKDRDRDKEKKKSSHESSKSNGGSSSSASAALGTSSSSTHHGSSASSSSSKSYSSNKAAKKESKSMHSKKD